MLNLNTLSGPEINIKKGTIYFPNGGTVDFGDAADTLTFSIDNPGDTDLIISGIPMIEVTGNDVEFFVVSKQPASTISPLSSTAFSVSFRPTRLGFFTAILNISSNDSDEGAFIINLRGKVTSAPGFYTGVIGTDEYENCFIETIETGTVEIQFHSLYDRKLTIVFLSKAEKQLSYL